MVFENCGKCLFFLRKVLFFELWVYNVDYMESSVLYRWYIDGWIYNYIHFVSDFSLGQTRWCRFLLEGLTVMRLDLAFTRFQRLVCCWFYVISFWYVQQTKLLCSRSLIIIFVFLASARRLGALLHQYAKRRGRKVSPFLS